MRSTALCRQWAKRIAEEYFDRQVPAAFLSALSISVLRLVYICVFLSLNRGQESYRKCHSVYRALHGDACLHYKDARVPNAEKWGFAFHLSRKLRLELVIGK